MVHVSKLMASHPLLGNLATNRVTNKHNEANAVNLSAFLPQRNLYLVEEQRSKDLNSHSKLGMDVLDLHKAKTSAGITRIGSISFPPPKEPFACRGAKFQGPKLLQQVGDGRARFAQNQDKHGDHTHRLHHKHAGHNISMHQQLRSDLSHHLGLGSRADPTHHHDNNLTADA